MTMLAHVLLLAAALAGYAWYLKGGPFPPRVLARRRFARRAARSAALFGGGSALLLALGGRLAAVVELPAEFAAPSAQARAWLPGLDEPVAFALIGLGLLIGGGIGAALSRWRGRVFAFGDVTAVMPRDRSELGSAALLAIVSGISEELFFRLALPLLVTLATGSAWIGFGVATALFGAAHRYQGWTGVAATTAMGAGVAALYLASGRLWMAVALHVAVNLNGLVIRPWLMGLERRPG